MTNEQWVWNGMQILVVTFTIIDLVAIPMFVGARWAGRGRRLGPLVTDISPPRENGLLPRFARITVIVASSLLLLLGIGGYWDAALWDAAV